MNAWVRKRNRDSLISQRNWYSQFRKESNVLLPGLPGDADSNLYWLLPIFPLHLPTLNTLHLSPHSHTSPSIHLHVTWVSCCPFLMLFAWIHCVIHSRNPVDWAAFHGAEWSLSSCLILWVYLVSTPGSSTSGLWHYVQSLELPNLRLYWLFFFSLAGTYCAFVHVCVCACVNFI